MRCEYQLTVVAKCPIDNARDSYQVTIRTSRIVKVEDILAAAKELAETPLFQEELTSKLASKLAVEVETVGWHSGVRATCLSGNR